MKLTYMLSPTTPYIMHTQASNILSENLLRNKNIDVDFNLSILSLNFEILNKRNEIVDQINNKPKNAFEVYCKNSSPNLLRVLGGIQSTREGFFADVIKTIKTDIVLITCWNIYSIPFIQYLLENGKRVVIGGSFCNCYPSEFIRSLLPGLGDNLMIVRGYVGVNTDLHKLVNDWRDVEIPENDFVDMWTASNDHIKKYLTLLSRARGLDNTYYSITFNNNCWYNKCKFCKLREKPEPNFIKTVGVEALYNNILTNMDEYGSKNIIINDNYFLFNDKNRRILKKLRRSGFKIYILSGIIKLMSKKYLEDINECVDEMGIGLESTTNFSLDYITKGYTWSDIKQSIEMMNMYLDRDKRVRYLYIVDLVSKDRQDIIQRYENMVEMKSRLNDYGFEKIEFSPTPLQLFPSVDMLEDTKYLKVKQNCNELTSGMWYVYDQLHTKFNIEINVPSKIMLPFERYDINGSLLKSDFEYIDVELMDKIRSF